MLEYLNPHACLLACLTCLNYVVFPIHDSLPYSMVLNCCFDADRVYSCVLLKNINILQGRSTSFLFPCFCVQRTRFETSSSPLMQFADKVICHNPPLPGLLVHALPDLNHDQTDHNPKPMKQWVRFNISMNQLLLHDVITLPANVQQTYSYSLKSFG